MRITRVENISTPDPKPKVYTFEEIKVRPGIYQPGNERTRVITTPMGAYKLGTRPLRWPFLYDANCPNNELKVTTGHWEGTKFTEVFEKITICFDNTQGDPNE